MAISLSNKLSEHFEREYRKLNDLQKKAVDQIEGPVMVIAGPGTGKTQILSARIGKILLDTYTRPENILCLTYTEAGVIAMRKRLLTFIGPDAYKVNIYTFHAFCNDVIQENLSLFEKTSLDPISDLEKIQLLKSLVDQFPKNHPLKRYRGDVYYEIRNLDQLFSAMKREGWTPELLNNKIDEYLKDLPSREQYSAKRNSGTWKKGELRTDWIEAETEKMERLRAAVNEFERFQSLMREKNRYDFDDMINWVIRAFEENPHLLSSYQEKFQYILVDEYQDTSGTQNRLVQILINFWEKPNVFVVGDDDQSIYRFQGANVENMEEFASSYANDLVTVVLTNNYRSIQPILNISKTLISRNNERLVKKLEGLNKDLVAANSSMLHLSHLPVLKEYETERFEMIDITLKIQSLIDDGIAPGDIAVIYRENRYGDELMKYLKLKKIPIYSKRKINILNIPFTKKVIQLMRYIMEENQIPYGGDEMLFEILHYDFYNIPSIEIAKLTVEVNERRSKNELTSIRKLLQDKLNTPPRTLFDIPLQDGLAMATRMLEKLIKAVPNETIQTLFERLIRESGILTYVMKHDEKIWLMQILTALFDFIKEETRRNPDLNLQQLIETIDLMRQNNLSIPLVEISGTEKGVNLLTAHGSKGLEYEYIFLAGCNAVSWEKKKKPGGGYKFPDTMFSSQPTGSEEEELRRLFYVALTRARQYLYISYSTCKPDGKPQEASQFIAEILDEHELPVESIKVPQEVVNEFEMLHFSARVPEIRRTEEDFVSHLLDKFRMNVTALNNYLKCPLEFYFKNLIRIPSGKSETLEFGSAVHFAIQKLFEKMKLHIAEQFPPKEDMIADFKWYMQRHRENFTKEAFARRMEYGEEILGNYYDNYVDGWNKIVAVERNINNVVVKGVPIKGKIDKLEFNGKEVNVVDYKTGDVEKALEKLESPGAKHPDGGDYWRQAVFYKILVDNYQQKEWRLTSTEFDFIEPDKKKVYHKLKVVIKPEDVATVTNQIVTVWKKIQDRDFHTGCGKEDCHWCNFVKDNNLAIALHEIEEEEDE